jgi:hypothetical protein
MAGDPRRQPKDGGMRILHRDPASFETRAVPAPQDEVGKEMALRKILILRRPARRGLEGRTKPVQR